MRVVILQCFSFTQHQNSIWLDYSVQTMSYGQDRTVWELTLNGLLNKRVSIHVDISCGFIKHEDLVLSENSACQTNELFLSHREYRGTFWNRLFETQLHWFNSVFKLHVVQWAPNSLISVERERIQILSNCAFKYKGRLRDDRYWFSEQFEAYLRGVNLIDGDLWALVYFRESE